VSLTDASVVAVTVDGAVVELRGRGAEPLALALRAAGCTAVKVSCEEGMCGACTVLVDGEAVVSCLVPLARVDGRSIRTAAGAASHPVSAVLADELACRGALQCGMCIPGLLASATALLEPLSTPERERLDEGRVREAMVGNLCRCTGYDGLVAAVVRASRRLGAAP
jgi:aerobic-type carbon monoxide dehydrogenase small subunit (CoxS/CutS family)